MSFAVAQGGITWLDYVTLVGVGLTLVGILVGLASVAQARAQLDLARGQMEKTASAAGAAQEAMQSTERRLAANQALLLLPQLRALESRLEAAVEAQEKKEAQSVLVQWRDVGSQLTSFLSRQGKPHPELIDALEKSIELAIKAKGVLFEEMANQTIQEKPIIEVTLQPLNAMANVCVLVAKLTESFLTEAVTAKEP